MINSIIVRIINKRYVLLTCWFNRCIEHHACDMFVVPNITIVLHKCLCWARVVPNITIVWRRVRYVCGAQYNNCIAQMLLHEPWLSWCLLSLYCFCLCSMFLFPVWFMICFYNNRNKWQTIRTAVLLFPCFSTLSIRPNHMYLI